MLVKIKETRSVCINIFHSFGVNDELSKLIVDDLINNDKQGYGSHGVMRIKEYVNHIKQGYVIPENLPKTNLVSAAVSMVEGNNSFGVLVKKEVSNLLLQKLKTNKFGFVTFSNSGHVGRLADIAGPIIQAGGIIIGFLNFSGSGKNVIPFGGNSPKLCTNPIMMGAPSPEGPILIDFSTSSYSEVVSLKYLISSLTSKLKRLLFLSNISGRNVIKKPELVMPPVVVELLPPPEIIPASISVNNDKPNPLYPNSFPPSGVKKTSP